MAVAVASRTISKDSDDIQNEMLDPRIYVSNKGLFSFLELTRLSSFKVEVAIIIAHAFRGTAQC